MNELNVPQARAADEMAFLRQDGLLADVVDQAAFQRRLAMSLRMAARQDICVGLLMLRLPEVTLPRFTEVIARIRRMVRLTDCVAALENQTCAVLLEVSRPEGARCASDKLCQAFAAQGEVAAGLAIFPDDAADGASLWQKSQSLLERARAQHGGVVQADARGAETLAEARLDLGEALHHHDLHCYYQPIFNLRSGMPLGLEVLARWQHPHWGLLTAAEFMPRLAPDTPLEAFYLRLLEQSLSQLKAWRSSGLPLRLSLNVPADVLATEAFPGRVLACLAEAGLSAACLTLECSRVQPDELAPSLRRNLFALAAAGVCLCFELAQLNDQSTLALRQQPFELLKFDARVIARLGEDPASAYGVQALLALGRGLGRIVVATGVERAAQCDLLRALGCEYAQGLFLSEAMAAGDVARWYRACLGKHAAREPGGFA